MMNEEIRLNNMRAEISGHILHSAFFIPHSATKGSF
jgi:hypothetical protein